MTHELDKAAIQRAARGLILAAGIHVGVWAGLVVDKVPALAGILLILSGMGIIVAAMFLFLEILA